MLVRLGEVVPGTDNTKFTDISAPTAGSASPVVFRAIHDDGTSGLWAVDQGLPESLLLTGEPVATSEGEVTFDFFGTALQGADDTLVFYASDISIRDALWRITDYLTDPDISLVTVLSSSASNLTLNSAGRVAFEGRISGLAGDGLWVEDMEGIFGLATEDGQLLETQPEQSYPMRFFDDLGNTGGEDGRPSGFSGDGSVVFVAKFGFNNVSNGVYRVGVVGDAPVEDFVWTGGCDGENWVSLCLSDGNWEGTDGEPTINYPGKDLDTNTALIGIAPTMPIVFDNFPNVVTIESLHALNESGIEILSDLKFNGAVDAVALTVKEEAAHGPHKLTLNGESTVETIEVQAEGILEIGEAAEVAVDTLQVDPGGLLQGAGRLTVNRKVEFYLDKDFTDLPAWKYVNLGGNSKAVLSGERARSFHMRR